jgi:hypothetical protein
MQGLRVLEGEKDHGVETRQAVVTRCSQALFQNLCSLTIKCWQPQKAKQAPSAAPIKSTRNDDTACRQVIHTPYANWEQQRAAAESEGLNSEMISAMMAPRTSKGPATTTRLHSRRRRMRVTTTPQRFLTSIQVPPPSSHARPLPHGAGACSCYYEEEVAVTGRHLLALTHCTSFELTIKT